MTCTRSSASGCVQYAFSAPRSITNAARSPSPRGPRSSPNAANGGEIAPRTVQLAARASVDVAAGHRLAVVERRVERAGPRLDRERRHGMDRAAVADARAQPRLAAIAG